MLARPLISGLVASAAAAFMFFSAVDVAESQSRSRASAYRAGAPTTVVTRDENGRTTTRIVVTRRSYLDGGTEVLPGQRKFTDYVNPPGYRPLDVLGPGRNGERNPLNGFFDYGFRNQP